MNTKISNNKISKTLGFKLEDEILWNVTSKPIITGENNGGSNPSIAMISPVHQRVFCAYETDFPESKFSIAVGLFDYEPRDSPINWVEQENIVYNGVSPSIAAIRTSKGKPYNNPIVNIYVIAVYASGTSNSQIKISISTLQENNSLVKGEEFVVGIGMQPSITCLEDQILITYINGNDHRIYTGLGVIDYDEGISSLSFPAGFNSVTFGANNCEGSYPNIASQGEYCVLFYQGNKNTMYYIIGEIIDNEISWLSGILNYGVGVDPCIAYTKYDKDLVLMFHNPDTLEISSQIGTIVGHGEQVVWNDRINIKDIGYQVSVCSNSRVIISAHKSLENYIYYDIGDIVVENVPDN